MGSLEAHDPKVLARYEGLIFSTARRFSPYIDEGLEDIQQILRVKVFKALLSYDSDKARVRTDGRDPCDTYVFQCLTNQAKDLLKKRPLNECYLEDLKGRREPGEGSNHQASLDWLELHTGMATTHDEVYGLIDEDDVMIPNTLSQDERRVVALLYAGYRQSEVARSLGLTKRDMERAMRSVRIKMEDWRPSSDECVITDRAVPLPLAA